MSGKSGGVGGVEDDNGGFLQGYRLRGRGWATVAMVAANGILESSECNIKRDFGVDKGAALEIRNGWQGWGRQGSSGVRV